MEKQPHPEKKIFKYQWFCLSIGMILLLVSFSSFFLANFFIGMISSLGSIGWFGVSLFMSPQVRKDLLKMFLSHQILTLKPNFNVICLTKSCLYTIIYTLYRK